MGAGSVVAGGFRDPNGTVNKPAEARERNNVAMFRPIRDAAIREVLHPG
jgi:hypothetical protein